MNAGQVRRLRGVGPTRSKRWTVLLLGAVLLFQVPVGQPDGSSADAASTSSVTSSTGVSAGRGTETWLHAVRTTFFDNGVRPLTVGATTTTVRSWGVVSAPTDGIGPFPLVILLHGAHAYCASGRARAWPCPDSSEVPNHDGLSWLTEALARRGFVAVAIGSNEEYARPLGDVGSVSAALIERDVLGPLSIPGGRFASWLDARTVDRSSVTLVGHSRGGAIAAVLGRRDPTRRLPVPVSAVVLLAPTSDTVPPGLLADVPTAVVIGSCDGDSGVDGGEYVTARTVRTRRYPVALLLMRGARHNAVNERLEPEPVDFANPDCSDSVRLNARDQRFRLEELVPAIIYALTSVRGAPKNSVLRVARADDRLSTGLRVVHLDPGVDRKLLLDPSQQWPSPAVTTSDLRSIACPAGFSSPFRNPGTEPCHRVELTELVGRPASIHLDWTVSGGTLRLAHRRLPAGGVLVMRLFVDPLAVSPGTEVVTSVAGSDPGLSRPPWSIEMRFPVADIGRPIAEAGLRRGVVLWSERRIVLPADTSVTSLTVRSPNVGAIDVVGIEYVAAH